MSTTSRPLPPSTLPKRPCSVGFWSYGFFSPIYINSGVMLMFAKVRKSSNRQHKFHGICKSGPKHPESTLTRAKLSLAYKQRTRTHTNTQLNDYHHSRGKVNEKESERERCVCAHTPTLQLFFHSASSSTPNEF